MDYILGMFFLIFIFFYYYILGDFVLDKVGAKYIRLRSFKILTGFIFCYFISFIVGLPCQLFKVNWNIFFYSLLIINIIIFIFINKYKFKNFNSFFKFIRNIFNKNYIINWVKNNWVCLVFVSIFMFLSISNVMVLYQLNYDDTYYISKIINSIGAPALQNENYFNGMLLNQESIDLGRILNTYEISYGFWASLFHIKVSIFCRFVMNLHNYIIVTIVIKNLASLFLKKDKCQYVILPFFIYLISSGYLMEGNADYHIRSFDLWQFQTAMWYGGSVVRTLTIPIMFLYSVPLLLDKIKIKPFFMISVVAITMVSFSSVAIPIIVVLFFVLYILKFILNVKDAILEKNIKKICTNILGLLFIVGLLLMTKKLDRTFLLDPSTIDSWKETIYPYKLYYVNNDMIFKYSWIIILIGFLILLKTKWFVFPLFISLLGLIVLTGYFSELLCLTSVNFFFVTVRFFSAIQFMVMFLIGLIIIILFSKLNKNIVNNLISLGTIISVMSFIVINYYSIIQYEFLASGINRDGYDIQEAVKNETLILDIYNDIGEYFNTLPYGNYTLLAPAEFSMNGHRVIYPGFVMGSNRIQIVYRFDDEKMNQNYNIINRYLNNEISYNEAKDALQYFQDSYVLTFSKKQADELENNGSKQVYKQDNYYLMKLN